jgi:orotidine-5'-phosphate decarboxylase
VATPAEAIRNGADYLVMGRQITRAADPAGELARVLEEIAR